VHLEPFKREASQRITTHSVDVSDDDRTIAAFVDIAAAHGGVVDVLINSAGISLVGGF
jgi:NAD(P)-dependent dehydrogenase (short-subunit alcohol dehydrogenase family)